MVSVFHGVSWPITHNQFFPSRDAGRSNAAPPSTKLTKAKIELALDQPIQQVGAVALVHTQLQPGIPDP